MGGKRITEAEIIRRVAERLGTSREFLEVGIGDDAAVLKLAPMPNQRQLITADTLIEGVHFDLSYMSLADVGYKALAVNLSDINAMGGESVATLATLGVPRGASEGDVEALLDGLEAALQLCSDAGQQCALIGGDTVGSPQWMIGFTVLGTVEGKPLLRSGAKVGDIVWHSGKLGLSGVGLETLRSDVAAQRTSPPGPVQSQQNEVCLDLISKHTRPVPPVSLGPWLQNNGYATAAQDLSDSLSQVALQLAEASGVGIELYFQDYGFAPEVLVHLYTSGLGTTAAALLLRQAEDYQLLFTTPPEYAQAMLGAPVPCAQIGRVVEGASIYIDERGYTHELKAVGFEHL